MKFRNTRVVRTAPAVTAGAYSAGNAVGAAQQLDGIGSHNGSGLVSSVSVHDAANQKAAMTFLFFEGELTGTYADKAAPTFTAADIGKFLGKIEVATTDWTTIGTRAFATKMADLPIRSKDTPGSSPPVSRRITVVVITPGTPTYAAVTDIQFTYGFTLD